MQYLQMTKTFDIALIDMQLSYGKKIEIPWISIEKIQIP